MHPKPVRDELPLRDERKEMLRRVEQTHWLTSYQLHYSGYEKGHLKMDSQLRSSRSTRRNAHSAPQRVKPVSPPVPPTLTDNHSRTDDLRAGMTGPSAHRPVTFPAPLQRSSSAFVLPGEISADRNESARPHRWGHSQPEPSSGMGHTLEDALSDGAARERTGGPPALPGIRPRSGEGLSLKELQDSYSKTQAHRRFNSSTRRANVDLKDHVCAGRRHDFYGVNVHYLHG
uniref:Uncharacterized protein n=1 Tax=Knipowitschia caucasica TaxID=637954 RepID=A0AAV2MD25_KNICA